MRYDIYRERKKQTVPFVVFGSFIVANSNVDYFYKTMRRCRRMISDAFAFPFARKSDMCASGCYLFDLEDDINLVAFPLCHHDRSASKITFIKMVSFQDKFSQLLACGVVRESMEYRFDMFENCNVLEALEGEYSDMFSGKNYRCLRERGTGRNKHDVFVMLNVDGFSSKFSQTAMVLINA